MLRLSCGKVVEKSREIKSSIHFGFKIVFNISTY